MIQHKYDNFLSDRNDFDRTQEAYRQLVFALGTAAGQASSLKAWLDCNFHPVPGEICANVFSAYNERTERGILVTQWAPQVEGKEFEAWVDVFGDPTRPEERKEFLQVHCKPSSKALAAIEAITDAWLFKGDPKDEIHRLAKQLA